MLRPLPGGSYLLALEDGESVDDDQAELLAQLLERDQPEVAELRLRRAAGTATLWRRQIRVVRPGAEALLGEPDRQGGADDAPILRQPETTAAGELDRARDRMRRSPDGPYSLLCAGRAHLAADEPLVACRLLERALRLTPALPSWHAPVHNALAEALVACGAHAEAEPHLRASVRLAAAQWQGWALLADHHLTSLRHADVIETVRRCLEVEHTSLHWDVMPDRASLLARLGVAELLRHFPEDACRHLREALALGLSDRELRPMAERYLAMAQRMVERGAG